MPFLRAASLRLLPPDSLAHVEIAGHPLALCNDGGVIRAFQGSCPHLNGPLGQGNLDGGHIICPWHAWEFSSESGVCSHNPAIALRGYAVRLEGDDVMVDVP